MAYICLNCYETYKMKLDYCPKTSCNDEVEEIDDLMLPTIILLNSKGYITEFCCSGHSYEEECYPYIKFYPQFSKDEFVEIFKELPAPWYIERSIYSCCIRCKIIEKNIAERQKLICDINIKLLDFVNTLPSLYENEGIKNPMKNVKTTPLPLKARKDEI